MALSENDKESMILFPIGGQAVDAEGKKIEPASLGLGPVNDGGNPKIAGVSGFGDGPDVRHK
jgi:hypothetical protein